MVRRKMSECQTVIQHAVAFRNQVTNHANEGRISADRGRSHHLNSQLTAEVSRLGVEVVQHLHVIGDKADRCDHQMAAAAGMELADRVADVGL